MYNFCLDTNRTIYQPSGAQNVDKWQYVVFEFNTIQPPRLECWDNVQNIDIMCNEEGTVIGVRKEAWRLNDYNFDLRIFEERYNMIIIRSGLIGLLYAR